MTGGFLHAFSSVVRQMLCITRKDGAQPALFPLGKCQGITCKNGAQPPTLPSQSIMLFYALIVSIVLFYILFVRKCVLYYCYWVSTQLQLTNTSCSNSGFWSEIMKTTERTTSIPVGSSSAAVAAAISSPPSSSTAIALVVVLIVIVQKLDNYLK